MPRPQATLFINHLPHGDDATLHAQMAAYGDIVRCFIVRAPDAYGALGESKGYAFVEFGLPSQAKAALRAIEEGYDIDRRRCVPAGWEEFTTAAAAAGERGSRGARQQGSDGWLAGPPRARSALSFKSCRSRPPATLGQACAFSHAPGRCVPQAQGA
jgi:hypothetical protein